MADVIDVLYRLRNMAGEAADVLRGQIAEAQQVLDKLDTFADDAENAAEVAGSSDYFPRCFPNTPRADSGLVRPTEPSAS